MKKEERNFCCVSDKRRSENKDTSKYDERKLFFRMKFWRRNNRLWWFGSHNALDSWHSNEQLFRLGNLIKSRGRTLSTCVATYRNSTNIFVTFWCNSSRLTKLNNVYKTIDALMKCCSWTCKVSSNFLRFGNCCIRSMYWSVHLNIALVRLRNEIKM